MQNTQIEDLLEIDDSSLDIEYIKILLNDQKEFNLCKKRFKDKFYTTLLRSITHETFEEEEAKQMFEEILKHLKKLNKQLHRDVGIVVASIDYLSNIVDIMNEPKIIEEEKSEFIAETSTKDELTGLYLRDVFDIFLNKLVEENKRNSEKLTLLMFDIDDFKKVNDTYGHQKGDEVLSTVGEIFNSSIREMDFAARYGGEELSIIMPNTIADDAYLIANKIREDISKVDFGGFGITISIGISEINEDINTAESLISYADQALYQAKNSGKNKVIIKSS